MFTKPDSRAELLERGLKMVRDALKDIYLEHGEVGTCSRAAVPLHHLSRALDHLPSDIANGNGRRCRTCPHREIEVVHQPIGDVLGNRQPRRLEAVCSLPREKVAQCPIVRAVGYTDDEIASVPGYLARQAD